MESNLPDTMPTLSQGAHGQNSGGACVMEYVSVLAGERWSDSPECVHPMIAAIARTLNDSLYNTDRQLLVDLIPRFLHANVPNEGERDWIGKELAKWVVKRHGGSTGRRVVWFCGLCGALCGGHNEAHTTVVISAIAENMRPTAQIALLSELLDEFDRLAGRDKPKVAVISEERMARAVSRVTGKAMPKAVTPSHWSKFKVFFVPVAEPKQVMWEPPSVAKAIEAHSFKIEKVEQKV
jgi:hypothetical protein